MCDKISIRYFSHIRTVIDENGNKKKDYYHKVLEAKIVLSDNLILSLGTEFIENESENVSKQDCDTTSNIFPTSFSVKGALGSSIIINSTL